MTIPVDGCDINEEDIIAMSDDEIVALMLVLGPFPLPPPANTYLPNEDWNRICGYFRSIESGSGASRAVIFLNRVRLIGGQHDLISRSEAATARE